MTGPIEDFIDDVGPRLCIVPERLRETLMAAIDKALNGRPCTDKDREILYGQLLAFFDQHGCIPEFTLNET